MNKLEISTFSVKPEVAKLTEFITTEFSEVESEFSSGHLQADLLFGKNNWTKKTETFVKEEKSNVKNENTPNAV